MKKLIFVQFFVLCSVCIMQGQSNTAHKGHATFAGGNFWQEEALFRTINGVDDVVSGYAGGTTVNPTYAQVQTGITGHAETVDIIYDSTKITYFGLLKVFFESQEDPGHINIVEPVKGSQYRSIIFYRNDTEKKLAQDYILKLNKSGKYKGTITAGVVPFTKFYKAEEDQQHYIDRHHNDETVQKTYIPNIQKYQWFHPGMIQEGKNIK